MEKNMFENAYFGKAYKTRDGRKAIYAGKLPSTTLHRLLVEDTLDTFNYDEFGSFNPHGDSVFDIMSEWQNSFDEDKMNTILDEANKLRETAEGRKETGGWYWRKWAEWGYRKALNS